MSKKNEEWRCSIPEIKYHERITERSLEYYVKSPNGHNRIKMFMEPLDEVTMNLIRDGEVNAEEDAKDRAKILREKAGWDPKEGRRIWEVFNESVFIDGSHGLQRLDCIKDHACRAFREWLKEGPLCKAPVDGVKCTFIDAIVHVDPAQVDFHQIASMMIAGLTLCFLNAKPRLFESVQETGATQIAPFRPVPEKIQEDMIFKIRRERGLSPIMPPAITDESQLSVYHDTRLSISNCKVMEELEWILVKPIPSIPIFKIEGNDMPPEFIPRINRECLGFTARDRYVFALNLYGQGIAALPETIDRLSYLQYLLLDYNHLGKLPDSISMLPWLQILTLHCNWLISLPQSIGDLKRLRYLDISDNRLEALPISIGALSNLKVLNLYANPIKSLPLELSHLPRLADLVIDQHFINDPAIKALQEKGVKLHTGFQKI